MAEMKHEVSGSFVAHARGTLENATRKILHCLAQIGDDDVHWRPHATHNSIANLILHLCGNVRQWIISGVGGVSDTRDRASEFADRRPTPKQELIERLTGTVAEADATLARLDAVRLLERRHIQEWDVTLLAAIFDSVSHFVGHTHQIVYITRMRLGDSYRFQWVPQTPGTPAARAW